MYHTIIIEDDPMVASINQQYLQANPAFILDGTFSNGRDALLYIREHKTDLAIVDYYMPIMNGIDFIRACHGERNAPALIMITAANSTSEISDILSAGILDYIVKPFTYDRFQAALQRFLRIQTLRSNEKKMTQQEIDEFFTSSLQTSETMTPIQVKGIQQPTLDLLRTYLSGRREEFLTSDEIAKEIHLSRITVRRYLNYMLENNEITSMVDYTTGGRPSIRYKMNG